MDNAERPWELPTTMGKAALALLVVFALVAYARHAGATEARLLLEQAEAALAKEPPDRSGARAALAQVTPGAEGDPEAVAEAHFLLGKIDEDDSAFEQALGEYRASIAAGPNTRWALRASERVDWLRARSEGNFAPLATLERVRRDPAAAADPASVEALAREAESFPPGMVRVEARMLVAEAWLGRLHRPSAALDELRAVANDPKADALTARLAERELIDVLVSLDRIDEAAAEARAHASHLDPRFVRQVSRLLVRRSVRYGAIVVLGGFLALSCVAVARAARRKALGKAARELRKLAPVAALFVAFVAVGGGLLASNYESGNSSPFLLLGGAVLPLVLIARVWSAVGSERQVARVARSLLCGATVLAAAFLLLDRIHPQYLAGFGL
jgi:hypothetical protein